MPDAHEEKADDEDDEDDGRDGEDGALPVDARAFVRGRGRDSELTRDGPNGVDELLFWEATVDAGIDEEGLAVKEVVDLLRAGPLGAAVIAVKEGEDALAGGEAGERATR